MPTGRRLVRRTPRTHRGNVYLAPLDSRRAESAARERQARTSVSTLWLQALDRVLDRALARSRRVTPSFFSSVLFSLLFFRVTAERLLSLAILTTGAAV